MDKKLTDNEIIKALECCIDCNCKECPCCRIIDGGTYCTEIDEEEILDLINRKDAEIEQLRDLVIEGGREQDRLMAEIERLTSQKMSREQDRDYWMAQTRIARDNITFAKSEAIKEFEKLVQRRLNSNTPRGAYLMNIIADVKKEMTEGSGE